MFPSTKDTLTNSDIRRALLEGRSADDIAANLVDGDVVTSAVASAFGLVLTGLLSCVVFGGSAQWMRILIAFVGVALAVAFLMVGGRREPTNNEVAERKRRVAAEAACLRALVERLPDPAK